ncbi:MAG: transposase [Mizugakiibacter sp.]|uniref:REP-associated tyrosine transposase n=1 Tax=Mizugakiibacter sp. TaxID=1972610 RepID=UPI0031C5E032|nr:transposase [Xanthomonadaceae bacterium]
MPRYVRAFIPGGTFFFTVALLERRRRLLTEHIDLLRQALADVRRARPFRLDAIAVMPDHLHCIWTLPPDGADFSSRWHAIKAGFSRGIPAGERLSERRRKKGERGIWQRRFWEHAVRDERDFERHADYIHCNPVKHGHVSRAADWQFSSFRRFVERGIYATDWGASDDVRGLDME